MKKFSKKILCLLMVLSLSLIVFSQTQTMEGFVPNYTINEPYRYPVVPGMSEWDALKSLQEMIAVCQIPEDILKNMSTEALIETVFKYPLAINIFVYETPLEGLEDVATYFNGFEELFTRPDAAAKLEVYTSKSSFKANPTPVDRFLAIALREKLLNYSPSTQSAANRINYYDYTPAGTKITLMYNSSWADHKMTALDGEWLQTTYVSSYKDAIVLSDEDPAFNCHSYTFYHTSTSNKYWLQPPYAQYYMSDGSYSSVTPAKVGDKVWYGSAHSAVVKSISNGTVTVRSKWGLGGVFEHVVSYCPFNSNYGVTYWR